VPLQKLSRVTFLTAIVSIVAGSFAIAQSPESSLAGNSTRSAEDLIKYVRKPRGPMPPYTSKSISDKELADIAAFLRTVPKDPDPKTIPLLNQQ
jgi:mono/diheme cytochrome c family protein